MGCKVYCTKQRGSRTPSRTTDAKLRDRAFVENTLLFFHPKIEPRPRLNAHPPLMFEYVTLPAECWG